ncbi:MAG: molybdenum cofactor biosynthesis protein MoaE [Proteobacteria bacterium]|nr:molybdenum cofactor biosynthesis protein MoaE [Pseudomonadota bacterium]
MSGQAGKYGATATFVGTMRDFNQGDRVEQMTLEHYPGMTEKCLNEISKKASERWDIADSLIIHRVGSLQPNEPIVLVAVWSAHRAAAFEACRYLIEELKSHAPFWKREQLSEHSRWLAQHTPAVTGKVRSS